MTLPLTKTLATVDYADLAEELKIVDAHFTEAAPQHEARRWEYAMALRAENVWRQTAGKDIYIGYDIGGAGSPFEFMGSVGLVVDPKAPPPGDYTLEQFAVSGTELASAVFCLSVLEHVEDLDRFLYHLGCLVAPGGLLFLTMDCCGCDYHGARTPEQHHFHWDRKRIFTTETWQAVASTLGDHQLLQLGEADWTYHGDQLYSSYSFASLALVKRS